MMELVQGLTGTLYGIVHSENSIPIEDIKKSIEDYMSENNIITPIINVTEIDGGYKITVSDADGTKETNLLIGNSSDIINRISDLESSAPSNLSQLSEDSSHRTVTDQEKEAWNNKVSANDFLKTHEYDEQTEKSVVILAVGPFQMENPSVEWVQGISDRVSRHEQNLASKVYVDSRIADVVGSAPESLDTLKELSDALGQDKNFSTTMLNKLNNKVDKVFGKGLSTNDLTNSLLVKINNSASIDWVETRGFAKLENLNDYTRTDELSPVATTGNYNDLINLPVPDATLTISGRAADSKVVGDQIKTIEQLLLDIKEVIETKGFNCEEISNMIVSYFEQKTVSEVED